MSLSAKLGLPAPPRRKRRPRARHVATPQQMAQFPRHAHVAWRGLNRVQQLKVLVLMTKNYGDAFAKAFAAYTRSGARLEDIHYIPAQPHQTTAWFAAKGYKLAQQCSVSQWWVHANGHQILLVLQVARTPSPEDETLRAAIEALLQDLAAVQAVRDETSVAKAALVARQDINTDDYAIAYDEYVASLEALADDVAARIEAAADTRKRLTARAQLDAYDQLLESLGAIEAWTQARLDERELENFDPLLWSDEDPIDLSQPASGN